MTYSIGVCGKYDKGVASETSRVTLMISHMYSLRVSVTRIKNRTLSGFSRKNILDAERRLLHCSMVQCFAVTTKFSQDQVVFRDPRCVPQHEWSHVDAAFMVFACWFFQEGVSPCGIVVLANNFCLEARLVRFIPCLATFQCPLPTR